MANCEATQQDYRQLDLEQRSYDNVERREHLVALLVYFPELHDYTPDRQNELSSLLQPSDYDIIAGIKPEEVSAVRERLRNSFSDDFPVGF